MASADEFRFLGSNQFKGRSGREIIVHMYRLEAKGREATASIDPDNECFSWLYVDCTRGIDLGIRSRLHTPRNNLLRAVGLKDAVGTKLYDEWVATAKRTMKEITEDLGAVSSLR